MKENEVTITKEEYRELVAAAAKLETITEISKDYISAEGLQRALGIYKEDKEDE